MEIVDGHRTVAKERARPEKAPTVARYVVPGVADLVADPDLRADIKTTEIWTVVRIVARTENLVGLKWIEFEV